jgi:hypothetical protein
VQVSRSLPTDAPVRDQVVQYRDVGTELTVLPTINEEGYVALFIRQEVNAFLVSSVMTLISATVSAQEIPGPPIVTPNSGSRTEDEGQSGLTAVFWIESQSSFSENFSLSCSRTGEVASCSVQSSITIGAYDTENVSVTFATDEPGSGTLTLTATGSGGNDNGMYNVTVEEYVPPSPPSNWDLTPFNNDNQRCGDACAGLVISHSTVPYLGALLGFGLMATLDFSGGKFLAMGGKYALEAFRLKAGWKWVNMGRKLITPSTELAQAVGSSLGRARESALAAFGGSVEMWGLMEGGQQVTGYATLMNPNDWLEFTVGLLPGGSTVLAGITALQSCKGVVSSLVSKVF